MPGLSTTKTSFIAILTLALLSVWSLALEDTTASMEIIVSVAEQQMAVVQTGHVIARYPISTSKFGLGDAQNSYRTPLGRMRICEKIGDNLA
ncbi:MAG: murein L,D-transpeptidase, partial [Verrucomicrobiaceae bacterium]